MVNIISRVVNDKDATIEDLEMASIVLLMLSHFEGIEELVENVADIFSDLIVVMIEKGKTMYKKNTNLTVNCLNSTMNIVKHLSDP